MIGVVRHRIGSRAMYDASLRGLNVDRVTATIKPPGDAAEWRGRCYFCLAPES